MSDERFYRHPVSGEEVTLVRDGDYWKVNDTIAKLGIQWYRRSVADGDFEERVDKLKRLEVNRDEPTITITQAQVVAIFLQYAPLVTLTSSSFMCHDRQYEGWVRNAAVSFLALLGAPEYWAGVLVDAVKGEQG